MDLDLVSDTDLKKTFPISQPPPLESRKMRNPLLSKVTLDSVTHLCDHFIQVSECHLAQGFIFSSASLNKSGQNSRTFSCVTNF